MDTLPHTIVSPKDGKALHAFGEEVIIHLDGARTGGKLAAFTETTPPGGGPPPHYHENEDEWFFVQEGEAEFFVDGKWNKVPVGGAVFMPRKKVHTFRNPGKSPLKMLIHTSPAGFETFFKRCADVFAEGEPVNMEKIMAISAEHGIHFMEPEN